MKKSTPESLVLRSILQYLAIRKIWHLRMNTGSVVSSYKGKTRLMKFGRPGCADILAIFAGKFSQMDGLTILWIEVKAPKGVQSDIQKEFQQEVEAVGHRYAVVRSIEDVAAVLDDLV